MSAETGKAKCSQTALNALAHKELELRRARTSVYGSKWSSDDWWDIVLFLYLACETEATDIWSIAGALGKATWSVERWIWVLEDEGQVMRMLDGLVSPDGWELTLSGRNAVSRCLGYHSQSGFAE